jgi:uncharacterized protein YceK
MRQVVALAVVMTLLSGCARVGFESSAGACPQVVEYGRAEQVRVAEEVAALPEGAMSVEWLADYAVLRDQARICSASRG